MRNKMFVLGLALCAALSTSHAQPAQPPLNPILSVDSGSYSVPANAPTPFVMLGNLLPSYDPTATNTFKKDDLLVSVVPLWKTQVAAGSTPYLSMGAAYYFTRYLGAEAELVTLGDGKGSSTADSCAVLGLARKDVGNLAFYGMIGPCRDFHLGKFGADLGGGLAYRYRTGLETFADTRYRVEGSSPDQNGFLTRVGLRLAF